MQLPEIPEIPTDIKIVILLGGIVGLCIGVYGTDIATVLSDLLSTPSSAAKMTDPESCIDLYDKQSCK